MLTKQEYKFQQLMHKYPQFKLGSIGYALLSDGWDMGAASERKAHKSAPTIQNAIFSNPATVLFWSDGSKTVVKCQPGDAYDPEKGLMAAMLKKLMGNTNKFNDAINDAMEKFYKESAVEV